MVKVLEVFSGSTRPRHERAQQELETICRTLGFDYATRRPSLAARIQLRGLTNVRGYRSVAVPQAPDVLVTHHAIALNHPRQVIEIDLPLGLHNYSEKLFRRSRQRAQERLESEQVRCVIAFSHWAKDVFSTHYGPQVKAKTKVLYPLAPQAQIPPQAVSKRHTFTFISSAFRLKGGPQAVSAFERYRSEVDRAATFLIVTDLKEASRHLGSLNQPGIQWSSNNLTSRQINKILGETVSLLHPTFSDSFGMVALEAAAAGCSVVATSIASLPEIVDHQVSGYLIDPPASPVFSSIPMAHYVDSHNLISLLSHRDLSDFEDKLVEAMAWVTESEERKNELSANAKLIAESVFGIGIWRSRMSEIILNSLSED